MYIEQLYTSCLAEAAYYIESNGEAAIIDPIRDIEQYITKAAQRGAKIKYVFETHFHADFVSGHIDLARKTGAKIIFGPKANPNYEVHVAKDHEKFYLGNISFEVLHTPGHTPESTCYLLLDENNKANAVFTGDTLFVGDVGRPDLAIKSDLTQNDLAAMLYDSLHSKIIPLADEVVVYPAHGAGSSCGKNIGKETFSTIGHQKQHNYALQPMTKELFVKAVTEGLSAPPKYFFMDAMINKNGYDNIEKVIESNNKALSVEEVEEEVKNKALVLDVRTPDEFEKGFIPGAVNIGLDGQFAIWVGTLLNGDTPLVIVAAEGKEQEAILRLARVGFENVKGYLKGGFNAWKNAGKNEDSVHSVTAEEFKTTLTPGTPVLDVRKPGEWSSGVIENANLICLSTLESKLNTLDKHIPYEIHCAGGYRSMIAVSIMKRNGFNSLTNIKGGMGKIKTTGIPLVEPALA